MDEFPNLRAPRLDPKTDLPLPDPVPPAPGIGETPRSGFIKDVLPAVVMIVAVVALGVLGWYAYKEAKAPSGPEEIPIVKAEPGPYKTKPENPGGMEFANTDKSVYNMLGDSNVPGADEKVEQVVGKPEEPMPRDEIPGATVGEEPAAEPMPLDTAPAPAAANEAPKEGTPAAAPTVAAPAPVDNEFAAPVRKRMQDLDAAPADATASPEAVALKDALAKKETAADAKPKKVDLKKKSAKVSEKVKTAAATVPKSMQSASAHKSASGKYRVQLGAYRSESAAADAWKNMTKRFGKELSGLEMYVEKANLGTKGIFYRLQAGPLSTEEDARLVCNKLVAKKQGCLAVGS
jgi:hypothetical protein